MTVCEQFQAYAAAAVSEWDGGNNADLLELLAGNLGISLSELVEVGQKRVSELSGLVLDEISSGHFDFNNDTEASLSQSLRAIAADIKGSGDPAVWCDWLEEKAKSIEAVVVMAKPLIP